MSNTISNVSEAMSGKISTGRAVAETITETAIDVGKGWLIGTAVAAGVATTVGSAPVLVVGAITVGVTVGLDWACKKITGAIVGEEKRLTETVSDFVLDVGEAAIAGGRKVVSSVSSFVKSGCHAYLLLWDADSVRYLVHKEAVMHIKVNGFLPIGTVVSLKKGTKKLMIFGIVQSIQEKSDQE